MPSSHLFGNRSDLCKAIWQMHVDNISHRYFADANHNTSTSSTITLPLLIHRQTACLFGDELVDLILDESTMYRSGLLQLAHQPFSLPQSPSRQIGACLFRLRASLVCRFQLLPQFHILLQNKLKRLLCDAFTTGCGS